MSNTYHTTSCCYCTPLTHVPASARERERARDPPAKSAKRQKVPSAWFLPGHVSQVIPAGTATIPTRVCFDSPSPNGEPVYVHAA
ncbi:hypothetical protein Mal48_32610 [Thalassoglobus polymorphus]|uniref:Uncharacterized protein n=1 Tax=Thalassoglobus polymorphus TaxID=2527994 RepID=A0A517QQT9_9PLAN|nr:hypothetical protein Mal48_32610 [Thalassoglobus polymorphus]